MQGKDKKTMERVLASRCFPTLQIEAHSTLLHWLTTHVLVAKELELIALEHPPNSGIQRRNKLL